MTDRIAFAGTTTAEGRRIRGEVTLVGARTFRNGEWLEVDPAALVKADASNVIARFDHDPSKVLGRVSNDTLTVHRTENGIAFETAELPNTTYANDLLELAKGGYLGGSSFEIAGLRSKFSTDPDGTRVRRITSIKSLIDVSPVIDPAFASMAQAFKQEYDDMSDEPTPKVDPAPEPAKFTEQTSRERAEAFARNLPIPAIQEHLDSIMASAGDGALEGEALERYEAFASVLAERESSDAEVKARADRQRALHALRMGRGAKAPGNDLFASDDYTEAFTKYLRSGNDQHMAQFAQSIAGDGTQGGFTVPDGFLQRVTSRLKAFGGIANVADEITTSNGESLRWPSNDDTGNSAAIAAEGVAGAAGADLVFGNITLGAFSYNSNGASNLPLKVSLELLQDTAFDLAGMIGDKLSERIGRKQAVDLATGVGTTEPVGLLTKTPDTMTATVASLATVEHIFQVDAAYRTGGNCRWLMSDSTLAKLWGAQSTTNQPLFIPGGSSIGDSPHGTLYGFPITIDPAAGTLVAFGDLKRGYIVRRVRSVQVLVDPYSLIGTRQVAYNAWARMDANIQDAFAYSVSDWTGVSADT